MPLLLATLALIALIVLFNYGASVKPCEETDLLNMDNYLYETSQN